jgi:biotin transport system substrate-specific component
MNARNLGYIAVSTALLSISAWVAIPIGGIPFTLQILVLCLTAGLLGWKGALLSTLAYLLLGFIGIPVFAGFTGGVGVLLSPTGGYLVGFLPLALVSGIAGDKLAEKKGIKSRAFLGLFMGLGVLLCYTFGTVWFIIFSGQESASTGFFSALTLCVLPYIPLDAIKVVLAVLLTVKIQKHIKT